MTPDLIVGCIVLLTALVVLTCLTEWSRRTINRIAERDVDTAREILRDLKERNDG